MLRRVMLKSESKTEMAKELATFTLSILLSAAILRFLWNRSLVKHVSALRQIESIPDALRLSIALATVRGACD